MAAGIDLDLFMAGFAVQHELVLLLKAGFADMVGAFVIGLLFAGFNNGEVCLVDAINVANRVRGD